MSTFTDVRSAQVGVLRPGEGGEGYSERAYGRSVKDRQREGQSKSAGSVNDRRREGQSKSTGSVNDRRRKGQVKST